MNPGQVLITRVSLCRKFGSRRIHHRLRGLFGFLTAFGDIGIRHPVWVHNGALDRDISTMNRKPTKTLQAEKRVSQLGRRAGRLMPRRWTTAMEPDPGGNTRV